MEIIASGLLGRSRAETPRATLTFPTVTALANGSLLATWRAGSSKDGDDETIEFCRSEDGGYTWGDPWQPFGPVQVDGLAGSLKVCYLTEVAPAHLLAAAMWVDRTSYPGQPLFNEESEGCLPMAILLAESDDGGETWSAWRRVPMPPEIGPPSLTNPVLVLADGSLAMSIETNKAYHDPGPWHQKVVFFHSHDRGSSWGEPVVAGQDPSGRIFNWDQRCAVAADGRIGAFLWTYDSHSHRYLNIHRRLSADHGHTWTPAEDLGFADQAAHPAVLPDGRVVLAYVDRFQSHSIRARAAPGIAAPFDPASDVGLYTHGEAAKEDEETGALLSEMSLWSFGLPYGETLPDSDVMVVYYAGSARSMDVHWARLRV